MTEPLDPRADLPRRAGCCSTCRGSGIDVFGDESGGRCWDCYGTGHTHPLEERCDLGEDGAA